MNGPGSGPEGHGQHPQKQPPQQQLHHQQQPPPPPPPPPSQQQQQQQQQHPPAPQSQGQSPSPAQQTQQHQMSPQQQAPAPPSQMSSSPYPSATAAAAPASQAPPHLSPVYQPHVPTTAQFTSVQDARPQEPAPQAPMAGGAAAPPTPPTNPNPRQRSSIACLHCRRSKIRCVNAGIDTPCNACRNSGRECRYSVEMSKRGRPGEDDSDRTPKRTKNRKSEILVPGEGGPRSLRVEGILNGEFTPGRDSRDSPQSLVEDGILDPSILTPQIWTELFELFETHYGTDLPFLHSPTFAKRLREFPDLYPTGAGSSDLPKKSYDPSKLPGWEMLVLGILALTARFHPAVVHQLCSSRHGDKDKDPIHASEHYAIVLRAFLVGSRGNYIGTPNLAKIQALLMLSLYEWGIGNGIKAWMHVGLAIRMAQAMGLQFEEESDYLPLSLSSAAPLDGLHLDIGSPSQKASGEPLDPNSNDAFIEEEMRRRTFWSCFVMDRYLSSGKFRPSMLALGDLKLQLPSSQNAFLFGDRVCTALIDGVCSGARKRTMRKARVWREMARNVEQGRVGADRPPDEEVQIQCEYGTIEGSLSIHVRMVEIWAKIARWTCAGGIGTEQYPPWHHNSSFHQLNETLRRFQSGLPRLYKLSKMNIEAHIAQRNPSPYLLLQVLFSFSTIILHRELLPFLPTRCDGPQGPMDFAIPYLKQERQHPSPTSFYFDSARTVFRAARDVMDLIQTCQSRCPLPETPILGFGLYVATLVSIYALYFPHMDMEGHVAGLATSSTPTGQTPVAGQKAASQMLERIGYMRPSLPMANGWFRTLHRLHHFYKAAAHDTEATRSGSRAPPISSPSSPSQPNALEQTLRELGSGADEDLTWAYTYSAPNPIANGEAPWATVNQALPHHNSAVPPRSATDFVPYGNTPSASASAPSAPSDASSAPPPPGLSRGPTPTPSMDDKSPYQGPGDSLVQQLAHHASNAAATATTSGTRFDPTQQSGQIAGKVDAAKGEREKEGKPLWKADLRKNFSGDDVATFMDGVTPKEWAEVRTAAAGAWVGAGLGTSMGNGLGNGRDAAEGIQSWLGLLWKA